MGNRQITKIEPVQSNIPVSRYFRYPLENKTYKITYIPGQDEIIEEVDIGLNVPLELRYLTEMYNGEGHSNIS